MVNKKNGCVLILSIGQPADGGRRLLLGKFIGNEKKLRASDIYNQYRFSSAHNVGLVS